MYHILVRVGFDDMEFMKEKEYRHTLAIVQAPYIQELWVMDYLIGVREGWPLPIPWPTGPISRHLLQWRLCRCLRRKIEVGGQAG